MSRHPEIPSSLLVKLYTLEHLTLRKIAAQVGMSAQAVRLRLIDEGVKAKQGTWVKRDCHYCGKQIEVRRGASRRVRRSFCNSECYYASLEGERYKPWRQGCRIARAIVAQYFTLDREHVVHHEDRDNRNNDRSNLRVFANQSDHAAYHRGQAIQPIWDGSLL